MVTTLVNFIDTPIGAEIFLFVISIIVFTLTIWLMSQIFKFKKQNFLSAFLISLVTAGLAFAMRLGMILLESSHKDIVSINTISMIITPILLIILIKTTYLAGWRKSIFIGILSWMIKWIIIGIVTLFIVVCCTSVLQDIQSEQKWKDPSTAQEIISFDIKEPTYLPEGYRVMSIKPMNNPEGGYNTKAVGLYYSYRRGGSVISLHEIIRETPFVPPSIGAERIIINNNIGTYYETYGSRGVPYLNWYDNETKILFSIHDSIGNKLTKENLIRIAESIE